MAKRFRNMEKIIGSSPIIPTNIKKGIKYVFNTRRYNEGNDSFF